MHDAAGHPLTYFHFGGDEVPHTAWLGSPVCQRLMQEEGYTGYDDIKRLFFHTVVNASLGTDLSPSGVVMEYDPNPCHPVALKGGV